MSLFEQLGQQAQMTNPMQMLSRLRSDPSGVLKQMGLSIPAGMNDPRQIIQHLVQSGQIPQARYNQALNMLGRK
ncbi:MAG: hypothetical protein J6P40_10705 [Oscillospiraceae bacterium]|nr:hypothetical protein [Oscillospiraceae bacterium]